MAPYVRLGSNRTRVNLTATYITTVDSSHKAFEFEVFNGVSLTYTF